MREICVVSMKLTREVADAVFELVAEEFARLRTINLCLFIITDARLHPALLSLLQDVQD